MTKAKNDKLLKKHFGNKGSVMGRELKMSDSKVSQVLKGTQKFTVEAVGLLLNKYHIDPLWLYEGDDDEEIKYIKTTPDQEVLNKYIVAMEKNSILMEEVSEYKTQQIASLKNSSNVDEHKQ